MAELTKETCVLIRADITGWRSNAVIVDLLDTIESQWTTNDDLRARLEAAERALAHAHTKLGWVDGPHDDVDGCPTWHDGCHCLVETLVHSIKRAETAERERDVALDMYSDAVKACTGVVPRLGPDADRGGILGPRPLAEMVRGLAAERDSWRSQAAVEATCLGRVSERADALEARVLELKRERDEAMAVAQRAMDNEYAGSFARDAAEARVREMEAALREFCDAFMHRTDEGRYSKAFGMAGAALAGQPTPTPVRCPKCGSTTGVVIYPDGLCRGCIHEDPTPVRIDAVLKKGGAR